MPKGIHGYHPPCSVVENGVSCPNPHFGRGYCSKHWQRWNRHGDPLGRERYPFPENLFRRIELQPDGCIYFTGSIATAGHGAVRRGDKMVGAHVAMWEWMIGPIPDGLVIDHICHDPEVCKLGDACLHRRCVNVAHMEPVTQAVNALRGGGVPAINARKTECKYGHPFNEENTYRHQDKRGRWQRDCRLCADRRRADYLARKAAVK